MTIFIIVALLIIIAVLAFFVVRRNFPIRTGISPEISPVYNYFVECVEEKVSKGAEILGTQGGYIETPEFEAGNDFKPLSSQLDFFGNPIPYWYYVSANGIEKEQIPSKSKMQEQLEDYLENEIKKCGFDDFISQGYEIEMPNEENIKISVKISNNKISTSLYMPLTILKGPALNKIDNHKIEVGSKLGKFYDIAKDIYYEEQETDFLENYAIDTLRMYAPVTGVEMTCSPLVWSANNVSYNLRHAIEQNTIAIEKSQEKYFDLDIDTQGESISFITSEDWPFRIQIEPTDGALMMAEPVGVQQGIGILGFCYVPYHFVYDLEYPILIQVYDREEIFQFPVAVMIDNNIPIESDKGKVVETELFEFCKYKNSEVEVRVYDNNLQPVNAEISYECMGVTCNIGKASNGYLKTDFPQCVNGYITAKAEGYDDAKNIFSSNDDLSADIVMEKLYDKQVEINPSVNADEMAIISFTSPTYSTTLVYPGQNTVKLKEEYYNVTAHVYKKSSINLAGVNKEQCIEIPQSGIGGVLGLTREQCFDLEVPSQTISNVISGGGNLDYYALEDDLQGSDILKVNIPTLPTPNNLEELQENYNLLEVKKINLEFI